MAKHISRRTFIKGAAATMAVPYIITSDALGAPGRASANNRITLGQIGIGNQGAGLFNIFSGKGDTQMVAVCDVRQEVRERRQAELNEKYKTNDTAAYNDFREMIARDDIDAVVIGTPDHWHAIMSVEAAQRGKDVFCEKPLSLTVHEGRVMADTMQRYGRIFQTGSMQRSDGRFRTACELVRNGRIGKVQKIEVGLPNNGKTSEDKVVPEEPIPAGFDYDMWLGEAPWKPFNSERVSGNYGGGWRYFRDYSGGMMTDWGAHHLDITQWALGMDDSGPVEIIPANAEHTLTYRYASGIEAYLGGPNGVKFMGTDGTLFVTRGSMWTEPSEISKIPISADEIHLYQSNDHYNNWLDGIRTRKQPICPAEVGHRSATVCHLGNIATWLGRSLKWYPVKEVIVGDAEANRWLDRPRRAPWHL